MLRRDWSDSPLILALLAQRVAGMDGLARRACRMIAAPCDLRIALRLLKPACVVAFALAAQAFMISDFSVKLVDRELAYEQADDLQVQRHLGQS